MSRMIEREGPAALLRRLVPGRVRLALFVYDDAPDGGKPGYRSIPDHGLIVNVRTMGEVKQLWKLLRGTVEDEGWKRDRRTSVGPDGPVVPGPVADLGT